MELVVELGAARSPRRRRFLEKVGAALLLVALADRLFFPQAAGATMGFSLVAVGLFCVSRSLFVLLPRGGIDDGWRWRRLPRFTVGRPACDGGPLTAPVRQ
jgi:hypothetical protein